MATDPRLLMLAPADNVAVLRDRVAPGERIAVAGREVEMPAALGLGHKLAVAPIAAGERVIKYGAPIGRAIADIAVGEHVHTHNLASDYTPTHGRGG